MNRLILSLAALPLLAACAEPVEEPALQEASSALLAEPGASVAEANVAVVEPTLALSRVDVDQLACRRRAQPRALLRCWYLRRLHRRLEDA